MQVQADMTMSLSQNQYNARIGVINIGGNGRLDNVLG